MHDRRGDALLAELALTRGPALTRYAFLLTGERGAAQDLVQDAFVKVFGRLRGGFTPDSAEAYVRRAILTIYVDGYRRRQHWSAVRHLVATQERTDGPERTSSDSLDLRAALATLAPQERACVVLRFYEDMTVAEVAAQMQLATGTVKRYLSNAVHKLEQRLGPMPTLHPESDDTTDTVLVPVLRGTRQARS